MRWRCSGCFIAAPAILLGCRCWLRRARLRRPPRAQSDLSIHLQLDLDGRSGDRARSTSRPPSGSLLTPSTSAACATSTTGSNCRCRPPRPTFGAISPTGRELAITVESETRSSVVLSIGACRSVCTPARRAHSTWPSISSTSMGSTDRDLRIGGNVISFPVWRIRQPEHPWKHGDSIVPARFHGAGGIRWANSGSL